MRDKLYHFIGSVATAIIFTAMLGVDGGVWCSLSFVVGIEAGDFKNYGLRRWKEGGDTRRAYIENTVGDLLADILGVTVGALIGGLV